MDKNTWHEMASEEILAYMKVDEQKGLDSKEAERRLTLVGANTLQEQQKVAPIKLFLAQFSDFMVLVLIGAALISLVLEEYADAITILAIVILNSFLGFIQEYKAEKSLQALRKIIAPEAKVRREGKHCKIAADKIVPGDIVILETGDIVPADARLLTTSQLEVNEATLTGESLPVKKNVADLYPAETALGDRKNMVYMGTVVSRGKGMGVVADTGMCTEMGQIAQYIQQVKEQVTPLQKRLAQLGKWLVLLCLAIVGAVVATGILRGEPAYNMFLTGVSLAVAAIPEGLPAIVTVALAIGVQKMVKVEAIVRSLPAVETLGCATVICSDKTGTLTQNEMTTRQLYLAGDYVYFSGEGYNPQGNLQYPEDEGWEIKNKQGLEKALMIAALCNNAILQKDDIQIRGLLRKNKDNIWNIIGDPTEGALLVAAAKGNSWRETLEQAQQRIYEIPFDSERKRMSTIYQENSTGDLTLYCKGAPDFILDSCTHIWWNGKIVSLTKDLKEQVVQANAHMASKALRVLGLAFRQMPKSQSLEDEKKLEEELIFIALAGINDPPRATAKEAVKLCKRAGIKTVMITGDHKNTAEAVAKELNIIAHKEQQVITGQELDELNDYRLQKIINKIAVFARVSPKHKIRIVKAYKEKGHVVAMTGDGVNDAPAVKEADIGVSMGITGTDVTKEASSLILGNDDFATIVKAVKEGRIIYDNIKKFIRYLLSCNVGEVLTMFCATLLGIPLPLIPIQILWVNLVTDGLPAMALGLDPGDPDVMSKPPRDPQESIFSHGLAGRIFMRGVTIALVTLTVYILGYLLGGHNLALARTMAFSALVLSQLFYVFECRSELHSIFELGFFTNSYLVGAVLCSVIMQLVVIYLPFFQMIFKTVPLGLWHWVIILVLTLGTTLLQGFYRTVKIRRKDNILFIKN